MKQAVLMTLYVLVVAAVGWGFWSLDRINAAKADKISKALTECRSSPVTRRTFFD